MVPERTIPDRNDGTSALGTRLGQWRWPTFGAAIMILAIYTLPLGTLQHMWNPNEASRILLSVSLSVQGTPKLDEVLSQYGAVPQDMAMHDGHAYSDKAPGLSFLAAPLVAPLQVVLPRYGTTKLPDYWSLRHILTLLLVCVPTAIFMMLAARAFSTESSEKQNLARVLIFALATPILTYASVFFSHIPAGIMVGAAYLLIRHLSPTTEPKRASAFFAGLLAASAIVTEYPTAILVGPLALLLLLDRKRRWALPLFVVGMAAGALPLLIYNKVAWGTFLSTGYSFKATAQQAAIHAQGVSGVTIPTWHRLWGVLLSPRRGMLFYCPLLLCTVVGWVRLWKRDRLDVAVSVIAVAAYVTFGAGFVDWEGGWGAAARHLVPVLFLLILPLGVGLEAMLQRTWSAVGAAVLVGWSLGAAVLSVAVTPYFPELFTNPLAQVTLRSLRQGAAMRNVLSDHFGVTPLSVFLLFAVAVVAVAGGAFLILLSPNVRRAPAVAALVATLAFQPLILTLMAPSPTPKDEWARAELLRRIGYDEIGRSILVTLPQESR